MSETRSLLNGQLFVLSGPSGAGKSTIIRQVRSSMEGLGYSVSHTSRKPRPGEQEGIHYHFVSREEFEGMIRSGGFVEWAKVYDEYYGTSKDCLNNQLGKGLDVIMDVDPQGAKNIKKQFADAILIFVTPPTVEALHHRLVNRGTDAAETIDKRLRKAMTEIKEALIYDYIVINDQLPKAVENVASIIRAARCRTSRQCRFLHEQFGI